METPLPDPTSPQIISLNVNPFNIETLGLVRSACVCVYTHADTCVVVYVDQQCHPK